jgi:hypothetical protein
LKFKNCTSKCRERGGLHINADSVYVEVLPAKNGAGAIVVTDLTNRAMPIVRYKVGDLAIASQKPCECGRGLPTIEKIAGREADIVLAPDGKLVPGISLTENFALHIYSLEFGVRRHADFVEEFRCLRRHWPTLFVPRSRAKARDVARHCKPILVATLLNNNSANRLR